MRKQQRFPAVIRIRLNRAQEDDVISAVVSIGGTALKIGHAVDKQRRATEARCPFYIGELLFCLFC